jgi:hypothetical protein
MGRTTTDQKKHVVSFRVSDRELTSLQRQALKSGVSLTMLMRQSLNLPRQDAASASQG